MIANGNFYGEIAGRNIYSFLGELDYELKTSAERIEHLKKVLYTEDGYPHPFFERLFEQTKDEDTGLNTSYIKLILNTTDDLYTDTNVADVLRKMADYILFSSDAKELAKRDNVQYRVYKDKNLFKKIIKEVSIDGMFDGMSANNEDATVDDVIDILVKESNVIKSKGIVIEEKDYKDEEIGKIIKAYQSFENNLSNRIKENKKIIELIENIGTSDEKILKEIKEAGLDLHSKEELNKIKAELKSLEKRLSKQVALLRNDKLDVKEQLKRPIEFKSPLSGYAEPCYDGMDFCNHEHIVEVLSLAKKDDYNLQDEYEIIQFMINEALKDTILTDEEQTVLELARLGYTQEEITYALKDKFEDCNVYQRKIRRILESIAKKVAETFRTEEKARRVANGELTIQTKVCKKCGEEKSVDEFHKEGSGYKATCKMCRKKQ